MAETNINEKIQEKLAKFATSHKEVKMCEQLLIRELRWYNMEYPKFKADFADILNGYFPFEGKDK